MCQPLFRRRLTKQTDTNRFEWAEMRSGVLEFFFFVCFMTCPKHGLELLIQTVGGGPELVRTRINCYMTTRNKIEWHCCYGQGRNHLGFCWKKKTQPTVPSSVCSILDPGRVQYYSGFFIQCSPIEYTPFINSLTTTGIWVHMRGAWSMKLPFDFSTLVTIWSTLRPKCSSQL